MKYRIERTHMVHQGESKFYDIYLIFCGKNTVAVTNWGPHPSRCASPKGKLYGRSQIKGFSTINSGLRFVRTRAKAKGARGYAVEGSSNDFESDDLNGFMDALNVFVGDKLRIKDLLGFSDEATVIIVDEVSDFPSPTKQKVAEPQRPTLWGSW